MPRPKSELTTTAKRIGAKLTTWQYEEWKRLGASKWLKQILLLCVNQSTTLLTLRFRLKANAQCKLAALLKSTESTPESHERAITSTQR